MSTGALPGRTTRVTAARALVIAPHYDDEILGCGGLLLQLRDQGCDLRVVFATDGSGGTEGAGLHEDAADYAGRRRAEAGRVVERLGAEARFLELRDGGLEGASSQLSMAFGEALSEYGPDLVLCPSPFERTSDHVACFRSLSAALESVYGRDDLGPEAVAPRVLLYDVNQPALPDLLVDVSDQVAELDDLMGLYESQLERHGYWRASLGLRRFRTLSLSPDVEAAEGYLDLSAAEVMTRTPGALERSLVRSHSGDSSTRVSLIVRTFERDELLAEALASIAQSEHRRLEVIVVNDGGREPQLPDDFPFEIQCVNLSSNQGRAAAANAGVDAAAGDAIGFLDDDDLLMPEHLRILCGALGSAGVRAVYSDAAVVSYRVDEDGWTATDRRVPYRRDFDPDLLLFDNYIPFNTLLIDRALFAEVGPFDTELEFLEDWDFLIRLAAHATPQRVARVTCEYRHFVGGAHHALGGGAAQREDFHQVKARVLRKHAGRWDEVALARSVGTLRAEAVAIGEANNAFRDELTRERLARGRAEHELEGEREEVFRLRGAAQMLEAEIDRLGSEARSKDRELERLYAVEREQLSTIQEQSQQLDRAYGEIERLNALVEAIQSSRLWRLRKALSGER